MTTPNDPMTFRRVLGHYPTGVAVVTASDASQNPIGMVVGSFTSVSLDPPLVAFFPGRTSASWARIAERGTFCVNVLASHQEHVSRQISSRFDDKFNGLRFDLSPGGSPLLEDIVAWIDCAVEAIHEAGDHFIAVGRVLDLGVAQPHNPLLFCRGVYGTVQLGQ